MAASNLLLLSLLAATIACSSATLGGGTPILNVSTNKEVQDLGRFAVAEQNKNYKKGVSPNVNAPLIYSSVLEATKQVVNGVKYSLKLDAYYTDDVIAFFDAVVVVPPGRNRAKQLLSFTRRLSLPSH